jgi:Na+-driven multidrug efflux pump
MQKKYEMDLCTGSLWKKILVFSVPLMFSNILQVVFNMSDVAVVGKFAGPIALGSVGSTSILVTLFTGLRIGLASGVNALTALYIGSKDAKEIKSTVHTAAILCLAVGILLMVFGIAFTEGILSLLHTKEELMEGAVLYLRIYLLGTPALALYNFGNAVLSAAGDTRRPLYYLLFAGIINVILNLFFVIVCQLGVAGVAIASIISQYISALSVMALSYGVSAFMDCSIAAARGLGKTTVPTIIVTLGSVGFRLLWIYTVFAYFRTIESLYLMYVFSWAFTAVAEIVYFVRSCRAVKMA